MKSTAQHRIRVDEVRTPNRTVAVAEVAMAVVVEMRFTGIGAEAYDAVMADMQKSNWPPAHASFHVAGPIEGDWRVIDVWDSPEDFQRFAESSIMPLATKHGLTQPPHVVMFPVHNMAMFPR